MVNIVSAVNTGYLYIGTTLLHPLLVAVYNLHTAGTMKMSITHLHNACNDGSFSEQSKVMTVVIARSVLLVS